MPRGDEAVVFHRKIMALRHQHIAHAGEPSEFIKFGVEVGTFGPDDERSRVTGLVTLVSAEWEAHSKTAASLRQLERLLRDGVLRSATEHAPALMASAEAAGLDEIKAWPESVYERRHVDPEAVRERWFVALDRTFRLSQREWVRNDVTRLEPFRSPIRARSILFPRLD